MGEDLKECMITGAPFAHSFTDLWHDFILISMSAGLEFLKNNEGTTGFNEYAGVGVEVTPEQVCTSIYYHDGAWQWLFVWGFWSVMDDRV